MPRTDEQGVQHPVGTDPFDITISGPHVEECTECLVTDWGQISYIQWQFVKGKPQ